MGSCPDSKCCKSEEPNPDLNIPKQVSKTDEQINALLNMKRETTRLDNDKPSLVDMAVFQNIEFINKVNQETQGYSVSTDENLSVLADLFVPNHYEDQSSNSYDRCNNKDNYNSKMAPFKSDVKLSISKFFDKVINDSFINDLFNDIDVQDIEPFGENCTVWNDCYDPVDSFRIKVEARDVVLSGEHLQEIQKWWEMRINPLDYTYFNTITGKELQRRLDSSINFYELLYMTKKNNTLYFINRIELGGSSIAKSKQILL